MSYNLKKFRKEKTGKISFKSFYKKDLKRKDSTTLKFIPLYKSSEKLLQDNQKNLLQLEKTFAYFNFIITEVKDSVSR